MKALCKGKIKDRYESKEAAENALRDVQHSRSKPKKGQNVKKIEQRAFLCPTCNGYHLTSQR